ncbi:malto-oligosyltrehalose synthase [Rouxiella sp. T17]|uniref:malto-oligosyltrehalose synthase n=1 Tax=Rouxiella sp. T17 TaxID=3085684 RepID=UPI002FC9BD53
MSIPTATYRIQFRNGMTFDRAAGLVPYLQRLGISHLYASPIFTATAESTHGYDVTNANEIEPSLGGREGFDRLVAALKQAGLGLILDIVPNHMAASLENDWWRDVIEKGEKSPYARHFDIDWSRPLTLPFLGDTFEAALDNNEISIKRDPETGKPAFAYFDNFYPLAAESWQGREEEVLKLTDKTAILALHACQPWRLMSWRDAPRDLSYRRFFEITGLAGVRVEDKEVFDDTHRLILELVRSGAVQGLRVDHVDGLADPKGYLERLRQEAGEACYLTVEKILGEDEQIPEDWPISGTTGYEFIAALSDALVDGTKISSLRRAYHEVIGKKVDMQAELRAAKKLMVDRNFEGEFSRLLSIAVEIAAKENKTLDPQQLHSALRELLIAFPVYRTYGTENALPPEGVELLQNVAEQVKAGQYAPDPAALAFIVDILTGDVSKQVEADTATFRTRFQQLTGPLMAKSVEDTLFFRQNMELALNEVGAEPLPRAFSLQRFHEEMQTRLERQPDGISSTSTHDTKRGEDARARLYTLTEAPERWAECIARWRKMNHEKVALLEDGPAPKPAGEWMIYQALAGAWPTTLDIKDAHGLKELEERFLAFVEKALREAKLRTDWADTNDTFEEAVFDYTRHLLSPDNQAFLEDFSQALQPFIHAGLVNSLTQTVIKLTAPGVPDIYQGSEGLNFSLVDPDNRREPDFDVLQQWLNKDDDAVSFDSESWLSGRLKQSVVAKLLHLRKLKPALFRRGDYLPLAATGSLEQQTVAFSRVDKSEALVVILPRLSFEAFEGNDAETRHAGWQQTEIALPDSLANRGYRNILTGEKLKFSESITLEELAAHQPLILITD